jgi:hypothetical protein
MPRPVRFVAKHIWLVLLAVLLGCFTGCDKDELKALREANRIAEEARREQAHQNVTFAALETTLSEERQAIDRERAQAAERHDEAAKERIEVLADRRKDLEAARRDSAAANALLAIAPLGVVGLVVWAVLRAVRLMVRPRPEDSTLVDYLLAQPQVKTVYWDPHLLERARNLWLTQEEIQKALEDAEADDNSAAEDEREPDSQAPEESQSK